MAETGLERDDLAGNLGCSRQGEAPAPRAQCPLNRREGADLRLPGGAIGVAALHLQQLFSLHPGAERAVHRRSVPGDHALGQQPSGTYEPARQAPPFRALRRSRPLLEQRLPQVAVGDADVLAERQQLGLGEPFADVVGSRLQLGGALDDPLEHLALDQLACHRYAPALLFFSSAGSVSPEVASGSAGVTGFRVTASRNPLNRSMGIGKNVVELFSEEISVTVCA